MAGMPEVTLDWKLSNGLLRSVPIRQDGARVAAWREGEPLPCTSADVTVLFERHYAWLCRVAVRMINDRDRAHDVVMDVFVELYARRETIDQETAAAYLKRSVVNRTLTLLTRAARDRDAVDRATRQHSLPGAESGAHRDDNQIVQ